MRRLLFEDEKLVGEITEWEVTERFAEKKVVLGKEILTQKPPDQCRFLSPKPVKWRKSLYVIEDGKTKYVLSDVKVKNHTTVIATISQRIQV